MQIITQSLLDDLKVMKGLDFDEELRLLNNMSLAEEKVNKMKSKTYIVEYFCDHCDKDTKQRVTDGSHERDSSGDRFVCLECGRIKLGFTDEWEEPENE